MKTVLVVDDDKNFRLLLEAELTLEGYNIRTLSKTKTAWTNT